jgi:hypothetical protein
VPLSPTPQICVLGSLSFHHRSSTRSMPIASAPPSLPHRPTWHQRPTAIPCECGRPGDARRGPSNPTPPHRRGPRLLHRTDGTHAPVWTSPPLSRPVGKHARSAGPVWTASSAPASSTRSASSAPNPDFGVSFGLRYRSISPPQRPWCDHGNFHEA